MSDDIAVAHDLVQGLIGGTVETILASYTVQLHIYGERGAHLIQTGSRFVLSGPDGDVEVDPENDPASVAPLLPLMRKAKVSEVSVSSPATLHVQFDTGHEFSIPFDDNYEAWEVGGPNDMLIVALPGGDVSVWDPGGGNVARGGKGEIWKADQ